MKTSRPFRLLFAVLAVCVLPPSHQAGAAGGYGDALELAEALHLARQYNPALLRARAGLVEQRGVYEEVRSAVWPSVSANATYNRFEETLGQRGPGISPADRDWRMGVGVRQTIYAGGSFLAALRAQALNEGAVEAEVEALAQEVALAVQRAYFGALLADAVVEVEEANLDLLREEVQQARDREQAGSASSFEVLRAEVELANARPALIRARNRARIARDELFRSIGLPLRSDQPEPRLTGTLEGEDWQGNLTEALFMARENRGELQAARQRVGFRDELVTVEQRTRLPALYLVGGYEWRKPFESDRLADSVDGWIVGLEGAWNIFDGGGRLGRVRQAKSRQRQAEHFFREVQLQVEMEVRQAYADLTEARELELAAREVVGQADEALRQARERLQAGAGTQLDVLGAQVSLTTARANQVRAQHDLAVALASLRRAMGER